MAAENINRDLLEESLVRPVVSANTPRLGPLAVIAGVTPDLKKIAGEVFDDGRNGRPLYLGRFFPGIAPNESTLAGPVLGAPQAVMTLETLLAWGARSVVFYGWCGAVSETLGIGDVVHVSGAFCDEGTSVHYGAAHGQPVDSKALVPPPDSVMAGLKAAGTAVHTGMVWSTDAIYRETPSRVAAFAARGAMAVDMETSALLAASAHLGADICCLLVVSDAFRSGGWEKGFGAPAFKSTRYLLCRLLAGVLKMRENAHEPSP